MCVYLITSRISYITFIKKNLNLINKYLFVLKTNNKYFLFSIKHYFIWVK